MQKVAFAFVSPHTMPHDGSKSLCLHVMHIRVLSSMVFIFKQGINVMCTTNIVKIMICCKYALLSRIVFYEKLGIFAAYGLRP